MNELIEIRVFRPSEDRPAPFSAWLESLKDYKAAAAIDARLARVRRGNFGDAKPVGSGVHELRIDIGPGYRVYFGRDGGKLVILLGGGSKKTQTRDIETAKTYWKEYIDAKN